MSSGPWVFAWQPVAAMRVTVAAPEYRDAWIDWPGMTMPDGRNPCIRAGSPGQALASALAGMGRTILPFALAEAAIARGQLVAHGEPEAATRAYWLIAPPPQWRSKKVRALVEFLGAYSAAG